MAINGRSEVDSGGPGPDPGPPESTGTTHRRSRSSAGPVWWSPPASTLTRGVGGLVALFAGGCSGRHRAPGATPGIQRQRIPLMRGMW